MLKNPSSKNAYFKKAPFRLFKSKGTTQKLLCNSCFAVKFWPSCIQPAQENFFSFFNKLYNVFGVHTLFLNYSWPLNYTFGKSKNINMHCFKKSYYWFCFLFGLVVWFFYKFECKIRMSIKLLVSYKMPTQLLDSYDST